MAKTPEAALAVIKKELELTRPTFEEMNLNKLTFAKELEYAIQIIENNDYLAKMNMPSIRNALVNVSLSGITLNPVLKLAYLVPRKGNCCVDVSYMGMIKIVTDTGSVKSIKADVAYEKDTFDIQLGSDGYVVHKPYLGADSRGRKLGAYSLAILNDGSEHIDFMRWDEIMAIKARSESVKSDKGSPWSTDEDEMACKTVVKRHFKYLPKSDRALMAAKAIDLDNQLNGINFEKEQSEARKHDDTVSTPNAPFEEALATDEDMTTIQELLQHAAMPDPIYEKLSPAAVLKGLEGKYGKGALTKSTAEKYITELQVFLDEGIAAALDKE